MKALVIYDSIFGNTEQIAQAIGKALGSTIDVNTVKISDTSTEQLNEIQLLIVGSPTRAFNPTPAINTFLKSIPANSLRDIKTAAFDTGIALDDIDSSVGRFFIKRFGYAAKKISDKLIKKGGKSVLPPEGFFVEGNEGPLKKGELERAAEWAKQIITSM